MTIDDVVWREFAALGQPIVAIASADDTLLWLLPIGLLLAVALLYLGYRRNGDN